MYAAIKRELVRELADVWLSLTVWGGPNRPAAHAARQKGTGNFVIIAAALLPWTTAGTSIFAFSFLVAFLTTVRLMRFLRSLLFPASAAILPLCVIALIGTLWATGIPWTERFHGLAPMGKLLFIPFLIYHFQGSARGRYVFFAFAASCAILMLYSWVALYLPALSISFKSDQPGVPVKNYIDQSQGFAFCAFALAVIAVEAFRRQQRTLAIASAAIAAAFLANLAFVNVSRTALVYSPIIAALFAYRYLGRKQFWIAMLIMVVSGAGLWAVSPNLQHKASAALTEYRQRTTQEGPASSVALRLEFWKKSIRFVEAAPIIGHGTGSTKTLFERDAAGQTGLSAIVIGNPHNQTLLAAIQWGVAGTLALWAMWITHLLTFRNGGILAWIGLVAVVQNILSSLFNSHLTDFYQGWLYVFAVGIAAGMILPPRPDMATARKSGL